MSEKEDDAQRSAIGAAMRGEEQDFFVAKILEMAQVVETMPKRPRETTQPTAN